MPKQKIDCLFIHAPKDNSGTKPSVMLMAMGVFALADYLERNGYSSKIIHLGVEKIVNNKFSIENYLKDKDICLIGISLHWHYQSYDSINLVNKIKSIQPKTKIILGGFTASFFADEIMKTFKNIDFIIKGDAEIPLVSLMETISKNNSNFSSIPNLIWRNNNKIVHNRHSYVASEADINRLNFFNFKLMKNCSIYLKVPSRLFCYSKDLLEKYDTLHLCIGRGCSVNCAFCAGSTFSQQIINKRSKVIFRSHENVIETIKDAVKVGISRLYICFDPNPDRKYYIELFRLIRRSKINISMVFECWSIPTTKFIDDFKRTFGKGRYSKIVLSPETASETLRKLNKGFFYTNSEFLTILQYLKKKGIFTEVYFSYPLPHETMEDVNATSNFIELIKKKIGNRGKILVQDFGLDPGSPMFICPAKYKIIKRTKSFSDYCNLETKRKFFLQGFNKEKFNTTYKKWLKIGTIDELLFQAEAYFVLKHYEEAIKKAKAVIELAPREINAYFLLGSCYEQTKRNDNALEVYKKALKMLPNEGAIY
jgi:radical SAM superfamily enzyme YgiQ (UPF0313 family)